MKKNILIVDDSPTMRASVKFTLTEKGYDVETAENGLDGIKKLKTIQAEGNETLMIISDVNMPEMDGFTFVRIIKKTPFSEIPVLFLTTESQESKKMIGKEVGVAGWLIKPFSPEQLVGVVKRFVK